MTRLTAHDQDRLDKIARLLREVTEGPDPHVDGQVRFLRRLASASPEVSGEEGERCSRCGRACTVWSAPSPLWNAVIRGGSIVGEPKYGDMVCATCFMQLAEEQGVASLFRVFAEQVNVELETTTPSGRTWDEDRELWVDPAPSDPAQSPEVGEGESTTVSFRTVQIGPKPVTHLEHWPGAVTLCGIDLFPDAPTVDRPSFNRGGGVSTSETPCPECLRRVRRYIYAREVKIGGTCGVKQYRAALSDCQPSPQRKGEAR